MAAPNTSHGSAGLANTKRGARYADTRRTVNASASGADAGHARKRLARSRHERI
jgi:hypothetical protein